MTDGERYARLLEPLLRQAAVYAHFILRNRAQAEDAVQQAAVRGLERIRSFDAVRPLKGWLFAILHNCCIDMLRADYDALVKADSAWQSAGHAATFKPDVSLSSSKSFSTSPLLIGAIVALLIALRIAPKLSDVVAWGIVLHVTALAVALPWVARMARDNQNQL